jgi:hypothetical protein
LPAGGGASVVVEEAVVVDPELSIGLATPSTTAM